MARHRFVISLGATTSRYHRAARPLWADTLAEAEQWAVIWLNHRRKHAVNGNVWDRWSVGYTPAGNALPRIVAHGDVTGTVSSARNHGWVD